MLTQTKKLLVVIGICCVLGVLGVFGFILYWFVIRKKDTPKPDDKPDDKPKPLTPTPLPTTPAGIKPCNSDTDCGDINRCIKGVCTLPLPEVYHYDNGFFGVTNAETQDIAKKYNAKIADYSDIVAAQAAGADWCRWGWINDPDKNLAYPLAGPDSTAYPKCPDGVPPPGGKVFRYSEPDKNNTWGVTLYGPKPSKSKLPQCGSVIGVAAKSIGEPCLVPFSSKKWSQYS